MPLSDNLVAYWSLEEASGTRVDAHGTNDLADNNTVLSATGIIGTAADFERNTSEYLSIADNVDMSTGDIDFTIAFWVKPETLTSTPAIISKGWDPATNGVNAEYIVYYASSTSRFTFGVNVSTNTSQTLAANNFGAASNGNWYFVTAWHDAINNQIGIAVNAGTPNTTARSTGVNDGNQPFVIGAALSQSLYWDGLIDEVGFWKRVLTSDERTELYNAGVGRSYAYISGGGGGGLFHPVTGAHGIHSILFGGQIVR